jgi:hypothetical protein
LRVINLCPSLEVAKNTSVISDGACSGGSKAEDSDTQQ